MCGVWCVACGVWCVVCGVWCVVCVCAYRINPHSEVDNVCTLFLISHTIPSSYVPTHANTLAHLPVLIPICHLILQLNSSVQVTVETLQPWSEEELCRLYVNPQLEALEQFTDNFVMVGYEYDYLVGYEYNYLVGCEYNYLSIC